VLVLRNRRNYKPQFPGTSVSTPHPSSIEANFFCNTEYRSTVQTLFGKSTKGLTCSREATAGGGGKYWNAHVILALLCSLLAAFVRLDFKRVKRERRGERKGQRKERHRGWQKQAITPPAAAHASRARRRRVRGVGTADGTARIRSHACFAREVPSAGLRWGPAEVVHKGELHDWKALQNKLLYLFHEKTGY